MSIDVDIDQCPRCAGPLVRERASRPWCAHCEWNLDAYDAPPDRRPVGGRRLDRFGHRVAFALNNSQFTEFAEGQPPTWAGWSLARVSLLLVSAVLLALTIVMVIGGGWLIAYRFPNFTILPGVLLVLLGILLRPRLGRFTDERGAITETDAPALFALVRRVAEAIGAPMPTVIVLDADFNASAGVYGLRRRRVLRIGLPLWAALTPQSRVALLGHELAHFVNGDTNHGLLTQPAMRTFAELANLFRPDWKGRNSRNMFEAIGHLILEPVFALLRWLMLCCHVGLLWIAMRDHQRAEYAADAASVRAAGTDGAVAMLDSLVIADSLLLAIRTAEINGRTVNRAHAGAAGWHTATNRARAERAADVPRLRQWSIRTDANLFNSHPPAGLRVRLAQAWPAQAAGVVLSTAEADRIDAELAKRYDRAGRELVESRR